MEQTANKESRPGMKVAHNSSKDYPQQSFILLGGDEMGRTKLKTKLVFGGLALLIVPLLALEIFTVQWASRAIDNLEGTNWPH